MSSYIGLRRSAVLISLIFLLAGASSATSSWSPIQETSDDKISNVTHSDPTPYTLIEKCEICQKSSCAFKGFISKTVQAMKKLYIQDEYIRSLSTAQNLNEVSS